MRNFLKRVLKRNKNLIVAAGVIYFVGFITGIFLAPFPRNEPARTSSASDLARIGHNLVINLELWSGFLAFGFSAVLLLLANGLVLGGIIATALEQEAWITVFVAVAPHGIPELLGIFMAGAIGLKSLKALIRHLKGGPFLTWRDLHDCLAMMFFSSLLTIIAGLVEAHITPSLLHIY